MRSSVTSHSQSTNFDRATTFTLRRPLACSHGAYYKQFKLPPLKLTRRSPGNIERVVVHRGYTDGSSETVISHSPDSLFRGTVDPSRPDLVGPASPEFLEPTHHELQSKANITGWKSIRSKLLRRYTESSAMPHGQLCLLCANSAELLCEQCGPAAFFCKQCFYLHHTSTNIFHTPKEWEVNCLDIS